MKNIVINLAKWKKGLLDLRLTAVQTNLVANVLRSAISPQTLSEHPELQAGHCSN
jgi:hypothetical protein